MNTLQYPPPNDDRVYYLSGPIAGDPETKERNIERFIKAAADLRARGYKILSPIEVNAGEMNPDAAREWAWYMRRDVEAMMDDSVEGIIMLPGWEFSRGAQTELALADALHFYVTTLGECLVRPPLPRELAPQ
jgi:hypothetical protein